MRNPFDVLIAKASPGPFNLGSDNTVLAGSRVIGKFSSRADAELFVEMYEYLTDSAKALNVELLEARESIKDLREEIDLLNRIDI